MQQTVEGTGFRLVRQPRKPGSGRQHKGLAIALTAPSRVGVAKRRHSPRPAKTPTGSNVGAARAGNAASVRVSGPPQTQQQQRKPQQQQQQLTAQPAWHDDEAVAQTATKQDDAHVHVFDGLAQRRVLARGWGHEGSRRKAQPRVFILTFRPPPVKRSPTPPPSPPPAPSPAPPSPEQAQTSHLSEETGEPATALDEALHLDDLVALALSAARTAAARQQSAATTTPAPCRASVAPTPAPQSRPSAQQLGWPPLRTPAPAHTTPIEGIPERLSLPRTAHLASRGWATGRRGLLLGPRLDEASGLLGMTPVEGVPERMLKRPRLSTPGPLAPLAPRAAAAAAGGACAEGAEAACAAGAEALQPLAAPSPGCQTAGQQHVEPSGQAPMDIAEARDDACGAGSDADAEGGEPGGNAAAEVTAADIAAAASAAARAAMQRLQQLLDAHRSEDGAADASMHTDGGVAVPSAPPSALSTPVLSSREFTPAVVKMQNLAAAVASAVQRAAHAMGGPPSARTSAHRTLPPRPPSAAALAAAAAARLEGAGAAGPSTSRSCAASAVGRRRPSGASSLGGDDTPSLEHLIHRAAPGALAFPSRTPSPMGGDGQRWTRAGAAAAQLHSGASAGSAHGPAMVTPPLGATAEAGRDLAAHAGAAGAVATTIAGPDAAASASGRGVSAAAAAAGAAAQDSLHHDHAPHVDRTAAGDDEWSDGGGEPGADDPPYSDDLDEDEPHADVVPAESYGGGALGRNELGGGADEEAQVMALPDQPQPAPKGAAAWASGSSGRSGAAGAAGPAAGNGASGGTSGAPRGSTDGAAAAQAAAAQAAVAAAPARAANGRRTTEACAHERQLAAGRKSLAAGDIGLTVDEDGTRRSTRARVRPLQYWRGEAKSYGRAHNTLPTVRSIKMRTPDPKWPLPTDGQEKARRRARARPVAEQAQGE